MSDDVGKWSPVITAGQFEHEYAERSGVSVEWLRRYRVVKRCDCGEDTCRGWQMVNREDAT